MCGDANAIRNPAITGSECSVAGCKSLKPAISEPFNPTDSLDAAGHIPVILSARPGKWRFLRTLAHFRVTTVSIIFVSEGV